MASRCTIGESMRRARLARGYTAETLAKEAGVGVSTLFSAEKDRHYPGVLMLTACADVLGVSVDEYIGREVRTDGGDRV